MEQRIAREAQPMPTQIQNLASKPLEQRIAEFAKKLPDGEGWDVSEIMAKFNASRAQVGRIAAKIGVKRAARWFIVNPKTRQKYADKN